MLCSLPLAAMLTLGACDEAKPIPPVEVMYTGPNDRAETTRQAVRILFDACPRLKEVSREITGIAAHYQDYRGPWFQGLGMKSWLSIAVRFVSRPTSSDNARLLLSSGEVAHFELMGGKEPKIGTVKRSGRWLCGFPIESRGESAMKPVPELQLLDAGLPSLLTAEGEPRIAWPERPAEKALAERALPILLRTCPRIRAGYPGMMWMSFSLQEPEPGHLAARAGWKQYLQATITFFDNSMVLDPPLANSKGSEQAWFALGSGARTGILPLDAPERALCDQPPKAAPSVINVPDLKFLSQLGAVYAARPRRTGPLDGTAEPLTATPVPPGHSRDQELSKIP